MKYQRKTVDRRQHNLLLMVLTVTMMILGYKQLGIWADEINAQPIHPLADVMEVEKIVPVDTPDENIDAWIREAAAKYQNTSFPESYLKYQLHCLANKESGHRYDQHTRCGDNGKSCGLYQYRKATWTGFRTLMIGQGLATEIGSLWDDKLQVETTAWALSEGRHQNWGPWLRGACQ